jgi:hypothetical protein
MHSVRVAYTHTAVLSRSQDHLKICKCHFREDVDAMSVKELRAFLGGRGVSTTGFLEKSEFVAAAKEALPK